MRSTSNPMTRQSDDGRTRTGRICPCVSLSIGRDEKRYSKSGGTPPVWANNLLTIFQLPLMRDSER